MVKKQVERRDRFSVNIYRKKNDRCEVVFRKNRNQLFRLGAVEGCERLARQLQSAAAGSGKADVINLNSSRGRRWAVEIATIPSKAVLVVWELKANGISVLQFMWQGTADELLKGFG